MTPDLKRQVIVVFIKTAAAHPDSDSEIGEALNTLTMNLQRTLTDIMNTSSTLHASSGDLSTTANEMMEAANSSDRQSNAVAVASRNENHREAGVAAVEAVGSRGLGVACDIRSGSGGKRHRISRAGRDCQQRGQRECGHNGAKSNHAVTP